MVSSYSFRTCWAGKEDRLVIVQEWDVEANIGWEIFVCGVSSGRAWVRFPSSSIILSVLCSVERSGEKMGFF